MKRVPLEVRYRENTGKNYVKKMRRKGLIPGVVYGPGIEGAIPIEFELKNLQKLLKETEDKAFLVDLKIVRDGSQEEHITLLKEIQKDIITRQPIHVDFQKVDLAKEVAVTVEIELVGKPVGVEKGGILEQEMDEIEIVCLPTDIPDVIKVDVSHLDIGDSLHVGDIKLEKGRILADASLTVATVLAPSVEEEGEEAEEGAEVETTPEGGEGS